MTREGWIAIMAIWAAFTIGFYVGGYTFMYLEHRDDPPAALGRI